jgi:hypothetical protein
MGQGWLKPISSMVWHCSAWIFLCLLGHEFSLLTPVHNECMEQAFSQHVWWLKMLTFQLINLFSFIINWCSLNLSITLVFNISEFLKLAIFYVWNFWSPVPWFELWLSGIFINFLPWHSKQTGGYVIKAKTVFFQENSEFLLNFFEC